MIHNNPDLNNTLKNNNQPTSKPYMGNYTSAEIGNMARMGLLGGELNKSSQKQEMKLNNEDPQKFF
ncbi:hypothetical protein EDC18_101100 [Natranaerovirga pectinivora]|uniref:Uncharacterized protein n=1 Tax=Natranaerovirga pectinivora TaxID=682400 RepID=A0A4R3MPU5_9FIRM|nr:hypothetical protein [Natranaerovirga pectinivora]TCT16804.1 hypothetical protein EDC18_101100 [Natranaerovirga pectinivora]